MVALVKKYGAERIIDQQRRRLGRERSAQGAEDGRRDARGRASPRPTIETIVWKQPDRVLRARAAGSTSTSSTSRSRSISASCSRATPCCAARRRSSTLSSRVHRTARPQRRRADARAARRAHAAPARARARRACCGRSTTITPAVTCSVQATFTTGLLPREHGIVANGWYFRDLAEVWLWRQSNHARRRREDLGRGASSATRASPAPSCSGGTTCTASADCVGDAAADVPGRRAQAPRHLHRSRAELRDELQAQLGQFPLFHFWGPQRRHRVEPLDRRRARAASTTTQQADAHARLPAAPRLRPAAARARHPEHRRATCARSTTSAAS